MKMTPLKDYQNRNVEQFLKEIPLFADLENKTPRQYKKLLAHSMIVELKAGEVIIEKGQNSTKFYVLLEGQLDVFGGREPTPAAIDQLNQGHLFGTLGALTNRRRTATLAASRDAEATLLCIDFKSCGDLHDFKRISLDTKLRLYRHVVNNTRWRLKLYKQNATEARGKNWLQKELSAYPPYSQEPDTVEELDDLVRQASGLAAMLDNWNEHIEPTIELPEMAVETSAISTLFNNMKGRFGLKAS